jgi:hypothetical protein
MPKTSLMSQSKTLPDGKPVDSKELAKRVDPGAFVALPESPVEELQTVQQAAYLRCPSVVFAYKQSETYWGKLSAAITGLQEGSPCLAMPDPYPPRLLAPFKFSLLQYLQYYAISNNKNEHLEVVVPDNETSKPVGYEWHEWFETKLILYVGDTIVPAACRFKKAQCQAAQLAAVTLKKAAQQDWAENSAEHALSLAMPRVWARFTVDVVMKPRTVKSGKNQGQIYHEACGTVNVATAADWLKLKNGFEDDTVKQFMKDVDEYFAGRVAAIKQLAANRK